MGLDCPKQLLYSINKTSYSDFGPTYYQNLGHLVQKVFELYFNQGINKKPKGSDPEIIERVIDRVVNHPLTDEMKTTYPSGKSEVDLKSEARRHAQNGFDYFRQMGYLGRSIKSEVNHRAVFRSFRMFGKLDFLVDPDSDTVHLFDGKGNAQKNADERQLLYYALSLAAVGKKLGQSGFIYWQHGFVEVDVSPPALKRFVDEVFQPGRLVFEQLLRGVEDLPAKPEKSRCHFCNWKSVCPASPYRRPEVLDTNPAEITFT